MKKLTLTIAIVLGMTLGLSAQQQGGGLFERGYVSDEVYYNSGSSYYDNLFRLSLDPSDLVLPDHGGNDDVDAPLGGGIALLLGMGAAYAVAKKRKED